MSKGNNHNNNYKRGQRYKFCNKIMKYIPLTEANVNDFIGKKIEFTAENDYRGVAIIKSVDMSLHNPIQCECVSGDDLRFAFLDDHGLETTDGGNTYHIIDGNRCFSYSDAYREIFVAVCG